MRKVLIGVVLGLVYPPELWTGAVAAPKAALRRSMEGGGGRVIDPAG